MAASFTAFAKFRAQDSGVIRTFKAMSKSAKGFANKAEVALARVERANRRLNHTFNRTLGVVGRLGVSLGGLMIAGQIVSANIELDNSLQSLQAITGVTGEAFKDFSKEIDKVSKRQLIFAGDTAKAFELVGSAKPELLANAEALSMVSEQAIILAKAGKLETVDAVNALTVSLNQFGAGADKATDFVNILAAAQQKGSGTIEYLQQAITRSGSTMKTFGASFEDTVAILEGFAKAGIEASVSGTALSSIMGRLAKSQNKNFNPTHTNAVDIIDNLAKANLSYLDVEKLVGLQQAKNLLALINQNDIVQQLSGNLNETGNAQSQANIQMMSLGNILKQIQAQFKNVISTTDTGNDSFKRLKTILFSVAVNMEKIIKVAAILIGSIIAFKVAIIVSKVALTAFNIIFGLSTALMGKSAMALRGNTIAMAAYKVAVSIATAAQWLFAAAVNASLWPVFAIMAAIGLLIMIVRSLIKNWELVKAAFSQGGILKGLITIGKVILDAILLPVQKLLELIGKIPGLKIAIEGAEGIENFRNKLFDYERSLLPQNELTTTNTAAAQESMSREERITKQQATLNINDNTGKDISVDSPLAFPIKLNKTNGQ